MNAHLPFRFFRLCSIGLFVFAWMAQMLFAANINVLVVYDTTAKAWVDSNGGGMEAFALDVVSRMNLATANSGIDLTFSLAHATNIAYTHSDLGADLGTIQSMAAVNALRDDHAADTVALLVDTGFAYGVVGVGYLLSSYSGSPSYAYCVNAIRAAELSHVVTHEVGHNLGAHHSKYQTSSPGPNTSLNTYSAGWYFTGNNGVAYHTIMAYNSDGYGNFYNSAPYFSSPLVQYQGVPAGHAQNGDNARSIRSTMDVVAAYRASESLDAPSGVSASEGLFTNKVQVSWSSVSGATLYRVYRNGVDSLSGAAHLGNIAASPFDDPTADPGVVYHYWVKASDGLNDSDYSASDSGYRASTVLGIPTGVSASDGTFTNQVRVTWNAVSGASSYFVHRNLSNSISGALQIGNPGGISLDDTNVVPETTYYYWVQSSAGATNSGYSASDGGYASSGFGVPGNVAASDGDYPDKVRVIWDPVSGAAFYRVYRNVNNTIVGATHLANPETAEYEDASATLGIMYYYWVRANDGISDGGYSASDSGYRREGSTGTPGTPAWVAASDGVFTDRIVVEWPSTYGATHYAVYRASVPGGGKTNVSGWVSDLQCNDFNVFPGASYYYSVQAATDENGANPGTPSAENEGYRRLSPPASVSASTGTYSVKIVVNWSAATGASHYRVYRSTVPGSANRTALGGWATNRTYADSSSLAQGSNYYYSVVAAVDNAGARPSSYSGEALGKLGPPLQTMSAPVASDGTDTGAVHVTWGTVSEATHYRLYRGGSALSGWTNVQNYFDTGATPGTLYSYTVRAATDADGSRESANSPGEEGYRKLSPPANFAASRDLTNAVRLTWTAPSGASRYQIARGTVEGGGKSNVTDWISGTTYNDSNTVSAVPVYYAITASVNTNGERPSDVSSEAIGWKSLPGAEDVAATDGEFTDRINISWSPVADASHYGVFRSPTVSGSKTLVSPWLAGATTYSDLSPTSGVTYWYWVQAATNAAGIGAGAVGGSNDGWRALATTTVGATDGEYVDRVAVNWLPVFGASHYRVYVSTGEEWTNLSSWITATNFNHTVAVPGSDYWYAVEAATSSSGLRAGGLSESNGGWRALAPPASVAASDGAFSNGVRVVWNPNTNASHYRVYRADAAGAPGVALTVDWLSETSYEDATALPGVTYHYSVQVALDAAGYRPSSFSVTNDGWRGILPPSGVQASDDLYADRVEIAWSYAEGASHYQVYRTTSTGLSSRSQISGSIWIPTNAFTDTNATPGVQYYYSVKGGTNAAGLRAGAYSDEDPGRRSLGTAQSGASDGSYADRIRITWNALPGASRYRVWRAEGAAADLYPLTGWTNVATFDDMSPTPGVDYWYAVQASADINGNLVGPMSARDPGWRSLPAPAWALASAGENPLRLVWSTVKGAGAYQVYRSGSTSTSSWQAITAWTNALLLEDGNADPGMTQYYWVRAAVDTAGTRVGAVSASVNGWVPLVPPMSVVAGDGSLSNGVQVSWIRGTTNATYHRVHRRRSGSDQICAVSSWGTTTNFSDTSAEPGRVYFYSVASARDSSGGRSSMASLEDSGWCALTPPSDLVALTGLRAGHVHVEWSGVGGASHYRVWRSAESNGVFAAIGGWQPQTWFDDVDPVPGASRFYAVQAGADAAGARETPLGNVNEGWRGIEKPVPLVASDGTRTNLVEIDWTPVPGAARYRLYRASVSDGMRTALTDWTETTGYEDESVVPEFEYIYEVLAAADESGAHAGAYGASDTGWAAIAEVPSEGFRVWADSLGLTGTLEAIFRADRNGDGLPNGLEYALGANLTGDEVLTVRVVEAGTPVAETIAKDASRVDVSIVVEATQSLETGAWILPVSKLVGGSTPADRERWKAITTTNRVSFRLKAVLQP